ncbi:MAG: hypothetical protein ACFCUI_00160 [Bernardetiaceae bacterium]
MAPEDFYKKIRQKLEADPAPVPAYQKSLWRRVARQLPKRPRSLVWVMLAVLLLLNLLLWWRLEHQLHNLKTTQATSVMTQRVVDTLYIISQAPDLVEQQQQQGYTAVGMPFAALSTFYLPPSLIQTPNTEQRLGQFLAQSFLEERLTAKVPDFPLLEGQFVWTQGPPVDRLHPSKQAFLSPKQPSLWQKVRRWTDTWQLSAELTAAGLLPQVSGTDPYLGIRAGLDGHLRLSTRWELSLGLAASTVAYELDGKVAAVLSSDEIERLPQPILLNGRFPEYLEAQQTSLVMPIRLRYHLWPDSRWQPFVGFGITGQQLLRERFTYAYDIEDPDDDEQYTERSRNSLAQPAWGWNNLRMEAGLSRPMGKRWGLNSLLFYEPALNRTGLLRRHTSGMGLRLGGWWRF